MPGQRIEIGSDGVVHRLEEVGFDDSWPPPWMSPAERALWDDENQGPPEHRARVIAERAIEAGHPRITPELEPVLIPPYPPKPGQ